MNASIIMATFNGAKYVQQQIESILPYMDASDELIISDDGSTDGTIDIVKKIASRDSRIIFLDGPHKGIIKNFEFLLSKTSKDIIMFCDQDDIWDPEKINKIKTFFAENKHTHVVLHNMHIATNEEIENNTYKKEIFKKNNKKHGFFRNLIFSVYWGCCMAITKEMKDYLLPFSKYVNMHDQWIGLIGEFYHCSSFMQEPLIIHRIHGKNTTHKRPYLIRIKYRLVSFLAFFDKIKSSKKWKFAL